MVFKSKEPCLFIIFGATGNLARKKLFPAFFNLFKEGHLSDKVLVLSVGKRNINKEEYLNDIFENTNYLSEEVIKRIHYYQLNFEDFNRYKLLCNFIDELNCKYNLGNNLVFYFATSPKYFEIISDNLKRYIKNKKTGFTRVMIEKPFGRDLKSAGYLNKKLNEVFKEREIFRIDHYLGKDMIQNIMYIRFANTIFKAVWDKKYIDNVQIVISETGGIENRGEYYDHSGALRDMVQNHIFQILTLISMEKPITFEEREIRNEKVKILNSIKSFTVESLEDNLVLGQYIESLDRNFLGYKNEKGVGENSQTETYVALKLFIENKRWEGVPFYIKTGKRLRKKEAYIRIEFKVNSGENEFFLDNKEANILMIKIQPEEGVFLKFNIKEPGSIDNIIPVNADYCQSCNIDYRSKEAYERLIIDGINGDSSLFTRWDEVEAAWKFVDRITLCCKNKKIRDYEIFTDGPEEGKKLIENDGRNWGGY